MPLLLLMAIGAGIGAVAGLAVYGAKIALSKEVDWSWRDAAAHAVGGFVGGGLFPVVMLGLGAAGLPAAAAYVVAGGVSWGGIWTLAQDGAAWALGRREGLAKPRKYIAATAVGMLVSALLLPIAGRAIGPGLKLAPPSATTAGFLKPPSGAAALVKAEGEFLAYGAMSEGINNATGSGLRSLGRAGLNRGLRIGATEASSEASGGLLGSPRAAAPPLAPRAAEGGGAESTPAEAEAPPSPAADIDTRDPLSPFGSWAAGVAARSRTRRALSVPVGSERKGMSAFLTEQSEQPTPR